MLSPPPVHRPSASPRQIHRVPVPRSRLSRKTKNTLTPKNTPSTTYHLRFKPFPHHDLTAKTPADHYAPTRGPLVYRQF